MAFNSTPNSSDKQEKVLLPVRFVNKLLAHRQGVVTVVMTVFITLFAVLTLKEPIYEWDLFAYVANALRVSHDWPIEQLHERVYQLVQQSVPTDAYTELLGSPSRLVLSENSEAFGQTISFYYDARIIYIRILALLMSIGIDPVFACYLFSSACTVLSVLLLARLIPTNVPLGLYFALPFIVLACGLLNVARLATPDAFAMLVTIFIYFLLFRNRINFILVLLPILIFVRTDLILLIALFHLYFFVFGRANKIATAASGVATIAAYILLNYYIVEADSWTSLIGYSFGEKPTHPDDFVFPISFVSYTELLLNGLMSFSYNPIGLVYCMLTVIGLVLFSARYFIDPSTFTATTRHIDILFLLLSCVMYLGLHFLLFPAIWTRFFAAQYSLVAVVVVWTTFSVLAKRNYSANENSDLL